MTWNDKKKTHSIVHTRHLSLKKILLYKEQTRHRIYKWKWKGQKVDIQSMSFFRNILSNKHVDTDMEAGNRSADVELDDMDTRSRSAHYTLLPSPDSMSALPRSFPTPLLPMHTTTPNAAPPLLPAPQISSPILNINGKRSQTDNSVNKVRVVEQGSKISTIVRSIFHKF
jgi:hypothetical protein